MSAARQSVVKKAFDSLEKTPFGNVAMEELELAYDVNFNPDVTSHRVTPGVALREFVRQWNSSLDDGEVSAAEFLEYYRNLSPFIEHDSDFVRHVCNTWGLRSGLEDVASDNPTSLSKPDDVAPDVQAPKRPLVDISSHQYRTSAHNAHPDAPRPGKPRVPRWLKYDKVVLRFSMYSKEAMHSHPGSFNEVTREYTTKVDESFTVRKFVLCYFVEDSSIKIMETKVEDGGGFGGNVFLARTRGEGKYAPTDFLVGSDVTMCGRTFRIVDADKATRDFFRQEYPDVRLKPAESLPKDPNPPRKKEMTGRSARQRKEEGDLASHAASRRFMENDGKILSYECVWDDTGLNGDRRYFNLRCYLGDGTLELRELNQRNSGRPRTALLNLNRQRVPNPAKRGASYGPRDLTLGADVVYGRRMVIVGCDNFTLDYAIANDITQPSQDELREFSRVSVRSAGKTCASLSARPQRCTLRVLRSNATLTLARRI